MQQSRYTEAAMRWPLWSAKESAYKALIQLGIPPFMNPQRIQIILTDWLTDDRYRFVAESGEHLLYGETLLGGWWAHSVCTYQSNQLPRVQQKIKKVGSTAIRQELRATLAQRHGLELKAVDVSSNGVPQAILPPEAPQVSISFSHHQPYAAFAYLIN